MIYLNEKPVVFGQFPNGEINLPIKDLEILKTNNITFIYEDDSDFFKLAVLKGWLDDMLSTTSLYLTYMPYSRMDRINEHYSISLHAACQFINNLCFECVTVREPHSYKTLELLRNSFLDEWCLDRINSIIERENIQSVFFPDFGAYQRYMGFSVNFPIATGKKERDFYTGNIIGLDIQGEVKEGVLIVDDICSRGGTFVQAAKKLKEKGAKNIYLLVAYCEDNVFNGEIFDYIDKIYTSSERELKNHPRIIKIK